MVSRNPTVDAVALLAKMLENSSFSGSNGEGTEKGARQGNRSISSNRPIYEHCKKVDHSKEKCFELVGYPLGWRRMPKGESRWPRAMAIGPIQVQESLAFIAVMERIQECNPLLQTLVQCNMISY